MLARGLELSPYSNHYDEIKTALADIADVIPLKKKHVPEGLTIIIEGPQRVGKTLGMVIWALDAFQHGRNIFSTIQLGFPHEPLTFTEIKLEDGSSKFWNGHVAIDELNFFFDARRSLSRQNLTFGAYLLQQKKQGCTLTGTTHDIEYLDLRLRDNYDFVMRPRVYPPYPNTPLAIKLTIENGPLQPRLRKSIYLDCTPFLNLYDSFAVYNPFKEAELRKEKFAL